MKIRTLLAVALLAPTVAAAAAPPKSKPSSPPPAQQAAPAEQSGGSGLELGGFIGYETSDLSGLSLRLDGEYPFQALNPQIRLSFVGSIGYSHLTWDPLPGASFTANVFKFVPAARFTIPVAPQFDVFGDAGLGLAHIRASVDFSGVGTFTGSSTNVMMRLGVGGFYQVNPGLKLGAMLEYDPVFGNYGYSGYGVGATENTFLIQVGGMFKI
jgi:opacity protein-like surface antigen